MDRWEDPDLRLMIVGGNEKAQQVFGEFDLMDEAQKYKTGIANFYKMKLYSEANELECLSLKPEYAEGRNIINDGSDSVDPVDPLVDMFWIGVNASKSIVSQVVLKT